MIIDNYERTYEAPPEYGYPDSPDPMDVAKEFTIQEAIEEEERSKEV